MWVPKTAKTSSKWWPEVYILKCVSYVNTDKRDKPSYPCLCRAIHTTLYDHKMIKKRYFLRSLRLVAFQSGWSSGSPGRNFFHQIPKAPFMTEQTQQGRSAAQKCVCTYMYVYNICILYTYIHIHIYIFFFPYKFRYSNPLVTQSKTLRSKEAKMSA